jgi:tRNA pseudouridine38-40 synthase
VHNFKITLQYDGTNYLGWQVQPEGRTIQGELMRVLAMLDRRRVAVRGAGRTDAGAHAEGQVASFFLERDFDPVELRDAINANLDRDIRVFQVELADESFDARYSARRKTYRYQIWNADVVSPFLYRYVYHYRGELDLDLMRQAASHLLGRHDFSAFSASSSEARSRIRTLERLDIEENWPLVSIIAAADGFLRYMVRTIAGTLLEVGRGARSAESVAEALASRDRARAGPTLPAAGLTLLRVDY